MRRTREPVARLRDVAAAAGVSAAAVSRYLSGKLSLPADTSRRIDKAIRTLNYRPNPHAVGLSSGRSDALGLVIPDIANPFFARLAAEIETAVDALGYALVLCVTLNRPGRELEYIDRLRLNHVDGLIFMTNHRGSPALARAINQAGSVVLVDEDVPGTRVSKIFCDNEIGGYLATRHLLDVGHRRVAFVGGPETMSTTIQRLAGYRRALGEAKGAVTNVGEYFGDYTSVLGRAATESLLATRRRFTGIFYSSDAALLGGLEVLRNHGLQIPEEISVVSFDDVEPLHLFSPPISAIRQPLADIGRRSVEAVLAQRIAPSHSIEQLPVTLMARASVAAPPRVRYQRVV